MTSGHLDCFSVFLSFVACHLTVFSTTIIHKITSVGHGHSICPISDDFCVILCWYCTLPPLLVRLVQIYKGVALSWSRQACGCTHNSKPSPSVCRQALSPKIVERFCFRNDGWFCDGNDDIWCHLRMPRHWGRSSLNCYHSACVVLKMATFGPKLFTVIEPSVIKNENSLLSGGRVHGCNNWLRNHSSMYSHRHALIMTTRPL